MAGIGQGRAERDMRGYRTSGAVDCTEVDSVDSPERTPVVSESETPCTYLAVATRRDMGSSAFRPGMDPWAV